MVNSKDVLELALSTSQCGSCNLEFSSCTLDRWIKQKIVGMSYNYIWSGPNLGIMEGKRMDRLSRSMLSVDARADSYVWNKWGVKKICGGFKKAKYSSRARNPCGKAILFVAICVEFTKVG
ncbi:hypothetical protein L1987_59980 [Smallanthus sonchifolius]|uniref:Uncharacterized protein n=1 Tax=Smallanthus sonchifolius TaxID=185202 RepID=A0ACB9D707_9ASTR|nr:hypothetical protein L1987_59980 [Smallanthus sonchifolius]